MFVILREGKAINDQELIREAFLARERSWSPYSNFRVGAALLTQSGGVYLGCNIENAAYTPTNCAERTAFFKAVSEGERDFAAIAIVGGHKDSRTLGFAYPCGVCRQVMMEFCDPKEFRIIVAAAEDHFTCHTLEQLLPMGFGPDELSGVV